MRFADHGRHGMVVYDEKSESVFAKARRSGRGWKLMICADYWIDPRTHAIALPDPRCDRYISAHRKSLIVRTKREAEKILRTFI